MPFLRKFATPLVIGAFLLTAATGVLLFFEAGVGMVHVAHEWLSWALVLGVFAHLATNWAAFTNYFIQKKATSIPMVGVFALLLAASFLPQPGQREGPSPARMALNSLVAAPLGVVTQVANRPTDEVMRGLKAAGFSKLTGPEQSIRDIAGDDRGEQGKAFEVIFSR